MEIFNLSKNEGFSMFNAILSKMSVNFNIEISPDLPEKVKQIFAPMLGMR